MPVNLSHQAALHLAAIQASARSLGTMHGCVLAHLAFGNEKILKSQEVLLMKGIGVVSMGLLASNRLSVRDLETH